MIGKVGTSCLLLFFAIRIVAGQTSTPQTPNPQTPTDPDQAGKIAKNMLHHREIPEATLPCSEDECKWWAEVKKAGDAIRNNLADEKDVKRFAELLKLAEAKGYRPPIPNQWAMVLFQKPPQSTEEAVRKNITGGMALAVELRADGTVGSVRVAQGLGHGLDERAIQAAQKMIFLPAVRDRTFITMQMPVTMSIFTRHTYP